MINTVGLIVRLIYAIRLIVIRSVPITIDGAIFSCASSQAIVKLIDVKRQ